MANVPPLHHAVLVTCHKCKHKFNVLLPVDEVLDRLVKCPKGHMTIIRANAKS